MNKTNAFLVLLLVMEFYLFWRLDVALRKSKPLDFTEISGRIRSHIALVVLGTMGCAGFLTLAFAVVSSDSEWLSKLGPLLIFATCAVLTARPALPWSEVRWDENGVEGYVYSWRHPIIPKHRKVTWEGISEVKMQRGGTILLGDNKRCLLAWPGAYRGHRFLNAHLSKMRPDLFYAPYYIVPIPREK
ncbi:MAG: hypothetical protein GQ535_11320 [Rhodobacteraceae bacterium]|nr:hypothetical protein [Paracoccaceae bacterium]